MSVSCIGVRVCPLGFSEKSALAKESCHVAKLNRVKCDYSETPGVEQETGATHCVDSDDMEFLRRVSGYLSLGATGYILFPSDPLRLYPQPMAMAMASLGQAGAACEIASCLCNFIYNHKSAST